MRALPSLKGLGAIITAKCSNRGAIEAEISDTKEAFRPAYEKLLTSVAGSRIMCGGEVRPKKC